MYSSLEITRIDADMLPNQSSRQSLVEMMMQAQTAKSINTVSGFWKALRNMLDKLVRAQAKHRKVHKKMMKQCLNEDKFRKKEVAEAKNALKRAIVHRAKCNKSLKAARKALPGLEHTLKTYVKELKRARKQRAEEHKKYLERKADYKEAIGFLTDFIKYINKKLKGHFKAFSFVEFSEKLLQHSTKLGFTSDAVPALVAIAEANYSEKPKHHDYSYKPNEAVALKLKKALDKLLKMLISGNKKNNHDEAVAVKKFKKYESRLLKVISTLKKNIKRTKDQIILMTECVRKEKLIMTSASKKLARNDRLRKNALKMCNAFNNEFIRATKARLDEIRTMQEILIIVKKRLRNLPKDLVNYLEEVKDGWKKYINSTKFKAYVAYKRKHYKVNVRGKNLLNKKNLLK